MKKFTFLLSLLTFVLFSSGQNPEKLQKRMDLAKEKYTLLSQSNFRIFNHSSLQFREELTPENGLKSVTTTVKIDSVVTKSVVPESGELQNDTKDEYLYDSEARNSAWLNSEWNATTNEWKIWSKTEMDFNANGMVEKMHIYESYETGTEPALVTTVNAFYDAAGQLDSVQHWYASGPDAWVLEARQHYFYNNSGRLTEMRIWALEEDEGEEYISAMRFVFSYTNAGRMETSSMYFLFDEEEMLFFKTEYNYDNSGRLSHTEDWSLSLMSVELEKNYRTDFEYNAAGDVLTDTWSEWDPSGQTWVALETDNYTYHDFDAANNHFSSYMLFFGIIEEIPVSGKAVKEIETMEWNEGTAKLSSKTTFYYSGGTNTFAENLNKAEFSVYPNPAREHVTFKWNENLSSLSLEIYQVTGSRIFEKQISSGIPVSVNEIDNGIYFFRLNNGKQTVYSGKLIKK